MTSEEFRTAVGRLESWAVRHDEALHRGEYLVELDPEELADRRQVQDYCRRNGLPLPAILIGGPSA